MLKVIDIFVTESYIIIVGSAKCRLFLCKKRHRTKTCGVFPVEVTGLRLALLPA